ncbi:MAG: hypothetical protein E7620_02460 [Ruminococcaceae bacterium]|nr:hypothetical protein [Oscillospiraceae bacterium]
MGEALLKNEERALFALRQLYRAYGYQPYKMSKFEEYDLYLRNKDFLVSDRIIAFTDTNGRLMALKPDVTLSIIKNTEDSSSEKRKVYYNENVYRVSPRTGHYKEILQTGLECIGSIDLYDLYETVLLAAKSLAAISEDFVLDISHLGILNAILESIGGDSAWKRGVTECIASKNRHDLKKLCEGLPADQTERLCSLIGIYGDGATVLPQLEALCEGETAKAALEELRALNGLLQGSPLASRIRFDFSIVNHMSYYNGIVFRGFLAGISEGVLSGGRYDKLLRRMGKEGGAVGFALYLDLLEELSSNRSDFDVDALVLYSDSTPIEELTEVVDRLTAAGECVSVQKTIPQKLRYRRLVELGKGAEQ